jgi:5-carboxymethyl-2-hydroxymuconate isomerase
MNDATLNIAADFVRSGVEKAGVPLTRTLEAYVSITFARFIGREIGVDLLTVRVTRAMDAKTPRDGLRALADECLMACAFFEARLRRMGSIRHYVGLGQTTYDAADMTEQAYGFVHMRDVIAAAAGRAREEAGRDLVDRARAGSAVARTELAERGVVVGPWGAPKDGLLWR